MGFNQSRAAGQPRPDAWLQDLAGEPQQDEQSLFPQPGLEFLVSGFCINDLL